MDERVKAIRNDAMVGRGSCTSIDEGFYDSELVEALEFAGISTPAAAVSWARKTAERQEVLDSDWVDW